MKLTKELSNEMAKKMNIDQWIYLQNLNKCFYGCKKFKEPLYIDHPEIKGGKILNGKYMFHLFSTHALSPMIVVDMIANKIYKNKEDKQKMRDIYKDYEKY